MASLVLTGDTSGQVTLAAPAVAGTNTLTLQAATATNSVNTLATAVASTSGTSISFTSLPSWIKRITVMLNAVSSGGSSIYLVQLGTGGTATTTGYLTSASQISTGVSTAFYTTGFAIWHNVSNQVWSGHLTLTNISGNIWVGSGTFASQTGTTLTCPSAGNITLGGALDMVRFTTVNGTDLFNAGSVNILYEG